MNRIYFLLLIIIINSCGTTEEVQVNESPVNKAPVEINEPATESITEPQPLVNYVFKPTIKTVKIRVLNIDLGMPVISLFSIDRLQLEFDDLEGGVQNYYYEIIHCNADWTPSELSPFDYIDGFTEDVIDQYTFSSNTLQDYTHYKLPLPNDRMTFTKSGNYIVRVYLNNDRSNVVLQQRFLIVEPLVEIPVNISRPNHTDYRSTHQEVDFSIIHKGLEINNPFQDVKVAVLQNYRWDHAVYGLKPKFVKNEALVYDYELENLFPAGKEFRHFDIQSLRYQKERIKLIEVVNNAYHVFIAPDQARSYEKYYYLKDINGQYFINTMEYNLDATRADYAWVHFTLPFNAPLANGSLYVLGELTNWGIDENAKLEYNFERKAYETAIYLKQGYYNYVYAYQEPLDKQLDISFIEGNYFEAENSYTILVYYRPFGTRFDKLIGIQTVNSLF